MRLFHTCVRSSLLACQIVVAIRFDLEYIDWNLNQNETASLPLEYWGQWQNHSKPRKC